MSLASSCLVLILSASWVSSSLSSAVSSSMAGMLRLTGGWRQSRVRNTSGRRWRGEPWTSTDPRYLVRRVGLQISRYMASLLPLLLCYEVFYFPIDFILHKSFKEFWKISSFRLCLMDGSYSPSYENV